MNMGPSTALFSRARPSASQPKRVRGFLSLPGEIRNQIYAQIFESSFRCEVASKCAQFDTPPTRKVKLWAGSFQPGTQHLQYNPKAKEENPITIRISRPLGKYNVVKGLQTNWFASLFAINLVCKQIYAETLVFIYHRTTFVFDAPKRLTNFLSTIPKSKLELITSLELHYTTYACPKWTKDRVWQDKHGESWKRACGATAKKLVNLRTLRISVRVYHDPLRFDLRQTWVVPLLQFRRLTSTPTHRKKLETVEVDFKTRLSGSQFAGNHALAKASEDLHRLFGRAVGRAILGDKEDEAMAEWKSAWEGKHAMWQYHLGVGKTVW
jgi:hypothetical protein